MASIEGCPRSKFKPYVCIFAEVPFSCRIYDKVQEIEQKSYKTWFYDLWEKGTSGPYGGCYDRFSDAKVRRVEYHITREFFRNLTTPIESAYDLLDRF